MAGADDAVARLKRKKEARNRRLAAVRRKTRRRRMKLHDQGKGVR